MLTFFRLNDPYRLIIIFFMLLAFRVPFFVEDTLTAPGLNYLLIGEKLADGERLYSEVWDNIGPLAAVVYGIIDFLFGRSQLAYQLISWFLVFFQVFIFNRLLLTHKAYNENTYLPGLIYALLMSFFWDFFTLTPLLMSMTFVLLALYNIFSHIEFRAKRDEMILNIGLYLGLAYLFYLPTFILGLGTLVIFLFFTGTVTRRYLMVIYGFILPFILAFLYFLLTGRSQEFIYNFVQPLFFGHRNWYVSYGAILLIFSVPLFLLVMSLIKMGSSGRFNNYQARLNQAMFVWLFFSLIVIFLGEINAPNTYIIMVPALSFYFTHYFLLMRRKWLAELVFLAFFVSLIMVNYGGVYDFFHVVKPSNFEDYRIPKDSYQQYANKKILVLGEDMHAYRHARAATPFLDWDISKSVFQNPGYYDNLSVILQGFENDPPEVIIDEKEVLPAIQEKIVSLRLNYKLVSPGVYQRVNN